MSTQSHFKQLGEIINEDLLAEQMVCSSDPQDHIDEIKSYVDAGFDHVCIQHVGTYQSYFIEFCEREILPEFRD
ncbi:MAG: hypothetical protein ABFD07_11220 [Methanobacterium sp.]